MPAQGAAKEGRGANYRIQCAGLVPADVPLSKVPEGRLGPRTAEANQGKADDGVALAAR
ncbi:hypothetical protein CATMQ487_49700 [Sphaerotilus microaerophilus]|uniref:Uncharacterized protein n=1 Tax=Sphaerotilus microaerophilus TaxID=2914710 RepID=A0ABM7YTK9_9BURK|nr:hypothetical protein CATMQ487_49700 [Sphaerotilus sp. FB-5]